MDLVSSTCLFCDDQILQNVDIKFTANEKGEENWFLFCKYLNLSRVDVTEMSVFYDSCLSSSCDNCTKELQKILQHHQQIEQMKLELQKIVANLSANVISTIKSLNGASHINQNVNSARQIIASHFNPKVCLSQVKVDPKLLVQQQINSDLHANYEDEDDCRISLPDSNQHSHSDSDFEPEIPLKKKKKRSVERESEAKVKTEKRKIVQGLEKKVKIKIPIKEQFHIYKLSDGSFEYDDYKFVQSPETGFFVCGTCSASRRDKYTLTRHIRMSHMGIYSYSCQVEGCSFAAASVAKLVGHHVRVHGAKFGRPEYELIQCSKDRFLLDAFWTFQRLVIHKNKSQEKEQEEISYLYKCLQCFTFKTEDLETMKDHLRNHPNSKTSNETTNGNATTLNSTAESTDLSRVLNNDQDESSFNESSQQLEEQEEEEEHFEETEGNKINRRVKIDSVGNGKFLYEGKWPFGNTIHGIQCSTCLKFYPTRQGILRHIRITHLPAQFPCHLCGQSFRCKVKLQKHKCRTKRADRHGQIIETSPGTFLYRGTYTFTRLEGEEADKFSCNICGNVRKGKESLTGHIREIHEKRNFLTCDLCGKTFTKRTAFDGHVATHFDARDFICEACGKSWKCAHDLSKHKRLAHGIKRPKPEYNCQEPGCGATFTSKLAIQNHRKEQHANPTPPFT